MQKNASSVSVLIFLILLFPGISSAADSSYCAGIKSASAAGYAQAKENWEKELYRFANSKPIATPADAALSTLITKKSTFLNQWMASRDLYNKKEEVVVRAWRRFFAEAQLTSYPTKNPDINREILALAKAEGAKIFPKKLRARFQKIFIEARAAALETLKKNSPEHPAIERVQKIELFWIDDLEKSEVKKSPIEFFEWSVAYDPVPNGINIGLEALKYPNDATLFAVFAHEIAHSFDPCRWVAYFEGKENPFEKVQACLRNTASVGALKRDDSMLETVARREGLDATFAEMMKSNPTCSKKEYPPAGVQADQLPEAFADWFSAEVVGESKYAMPGLRADLCEAKQLRPGSSYVPNEVRLEKIYLANPKIRAKLKLTKDSAAVYCTLEK